MNDELHRWCRKQETKESLGPGFVLSRKVISSIVKSKPKSLQELLSLHGIGIQKIKKYGTDILKIVNQHQENYKEITDKDVQSFLLQHTSKPRKKKKNITIESYFQPKQKETPSFMQIQSEQSEDLSALSASQKQVFEAYIKGKNIFMTGPAGTGKTFLIKKITEHAQRFGKKIQCCALTGCAAVLLECNAKTIHSWSGVGILSKSDDEIIHSILTKEHKMRPWRSIDILIIDEVSMLNSRFFSLLNQIGQHVRKNMLAFGGIQIILSGDFYQLPPISGAFCFESSDWPTCIDETIELRTVFRQENRRFAKILNQIRTGRISRKTYSRLQECVKKSTDNIPDHLSPTIILPRKKQTDEINQNHLDALQTKEYTFESTIVHNQNVIHSTFKTVKYVQYEIENMFQTNMFERTLSLKEGAQVMCISNLDLQNQICNGSLGQVITISSNPTRVLVQFSNCERWITPQIWKSDVIPELSIEQLPLILAWSCTIHKIQGATLDYIDVDVGSGIFECGQTYVALSRVKHLRGLFMRSFDPLKILVSEKVQRYYASLNRSSLSV